MAGYWQRVTETGADDSPYRATFAQIIRDAEAERLYGPHISYFFNRCLPHLSRLCRCPGLPHDQDAAGGVPEPADPSPAWFSGKPALRRAAADVGYRCRDTQRLPPIGVPVWTWRFGWKRFWRDPSPASALEDPT
jgi:hypothetical protein